MARVPIALELYSVRHEFEKDPRGTMKRVAEMGYEGVEFAGPPKHPADELRDMLKEFGLTCCGWHTPFQSVQEDKLEETIELNKTVNNPYVIIPGVPENLTKTREGWLGIAKFLNDLSDKLAPHGMRTGYHNHRREFEPLEGEQPWDTLSSNTKEEVIMQLDTGNALSGGGDIYSVLKRYPNRAVTVHIKPYSKKAAGEDWRAGFRTLIGEDDTDWNQLFELCETVGGTKWYIVEYESDAYPPFEAVELCLKKLKEMGK